MIRVKPVPEHLQSLRNILPAKTARKILISSVNDASKWSETQLNRLIRETLTLNRKAVDDAITRSTTRDDAGGFGQRVTVSRKPIDLKEYKPKQTRKGLTVKMVKGGKRELIRSAFASKALGGHAFKREGKKRTPILKLKGATAIGGVLRREAEVDKIAGLLGDRVQQRFSSKLEYELNKLKSKLL